MVRRTHAQAAETRDALLAAAMTHFARDGFADTSLSAIAASAGTTKGAIFHHFRSKEELFIEVWKKVQRDMDEEARAAALSALSPADPFAAFLAGSRVYLDWATRPEYQRIVLVDGPAVLGLARWHQLEFELGRASLTAGTMFIAMQGHFPRAMAVPAAILLQAAINGAAFALSADTPEVTRDQLFDVFERMLRGLSKPRDKPP